MDWRRAGYKAPGKTSARLPRLRDDPDIRLRRFPTVWITLFGLFVGNGTGDNYVLALFPVNRRGDLVFGCQLKRVNHSEDFVEVAARCHGINEDQFDLFVWANDI